MTAASRTGRSRPIPRILALTLLPLGAVLLGLGAAHATCAATMIHGPGGASTTMSMEHVDSLTSGPRPWHLPGAASPSLTVLSISRT